MSLRRFLSPGGSAGVARRAFRVPSASLPGALIAGALLAAACSAASDEGPEPASLPDADAAPPGPAPSARCRARAARRGRRGWRGRRTRGEPRRRRRLHHRPALQGRARVRGEHRAEGRHQALHARLGAERLYPKDVETGKPFVRDIWSALKQLVAGAEVPFIIAQDGGGHDATTPVLDT